MASAAVPMDDDNDDFWLQQGDIIDQMVEQHTKERQTQQERSVFTAAAPSTLAPASAETHWASKRGPNGNGLPHLGPSDEPQASQQTLNLLAEKEGQLSILRDKLGRTDVENINLKRQLQELTNQPARSLVQKSASLHLEQEVQRLKQQLAFKEEELTEARRLRLQREEKLHHTEALATRLGDHVRRLEANQATAEAEQLLMMQGKDPLVGNQRASIGSPMKRAGPLETYGDEAHLYHERLNHREMQQQNAVPSSMMGDHVADQMNDARNNILSHGSDLIASITSHMHSRDVLEAQTAQALCLNISDGSLPSITQVLIEYVVNHMKQVEKHPAEHRKVYALGKGKTCLDSALHLMHKILYLDYSSRKHAAFLLAGSMAEEGTKNISQSCGDGPLASFLSLAPYCLPNEGTAIKVMEVLSMIVTSFDYEGRPPLFWMLRELLTNDALCQSTSKALAVATGALAYHLLESRTVACEVMELENIQTALFRFLEKVVEFGTSDNKLVEEPSDLVVNRQGFSVCALLYRQITECAEGKQETPNFSALVMRLGKTVVSVIKFLNKLLENLESISGKIYDMYDEVLIAVLEALSLLQVLLCDLDTARLIWKPTFRVSASLRQFHITMGMLLEGPLQLIDRSWPSMRYTHLQIPSLWSYSDQQHHGTPVDSIADLASWVYRNITQMAEEHQN